MHARAHNLLITDACQLPQDGAAAHLVLEAAAAAIANGRAVDIGNALHHLDVGPPQGGPDWREKNNV